MNNLEAVLDNITELENMAESNIFSVSRDKVESSVKMVQLAHDKGHIEREESRALISRLSRIESHLIRIERW